MTDKHLTTSMRNVLCRADPMDERITCGSPADVAALRRLGYLVTDPDGDVFITEQGRNWVAAYNRGGDAVATEEDK